MLESHSAHGHSVVYLVKQEDADAAAAALRLALEREIGDKSVSPVTVVEPVTMLSVVGEQVR